MSLTWIPALTAKVVGALDKRRLPRTIGAAAALLVLVAIGIVSLIGDGDGGEPKQVMRLEQRTGVGGPIAEAPAGVPKPVAAASADLSLVEMSPSGPLPRIADDGRKPMAVYSRPSTLIADRRPKIAVVIGGLGFGKALTDAVLNRLPADVSLAFTPQGPEVAADVAAARAKGHEVLLEIPMESDERSTTETGLHTLTTDADRKNALRLQWLMSRTTGYAGLINAFGDTFLASKDEAHLVMAETAQRGLFFVEAGAGTDSLAPAAAAKMNAPFARADSVIDKTPSREAIDAQLAALEVAAKKRGVAIGVAGALPNTIDRVSIWIEGLEAKGIVLVPVSALAGAAPAEAPLPLAAVAQPTPKAAVAKPRASNKARLARRTRTQPRATPPKRTTTKRTTTTLKPATPKPAAPAPQELPASSEPAAPHP